MRYRPIPVLLVPFVILAAGCGGGGGGDDEASASPFALSGTRTGAVVVTSQGSAGYRLEIDRATISRDGSISIRCIDPDLDVTDTILGTADADGIISSASCVRTIATGGSYTLDGAGAVSRSDGKLSFNFGFRNLQGGRSLDENRYVGTLN